MEQLGLVTICPFQPRGALLAGDELQVIRIDFGDEQRHVALHAVIARIRDHDVAGLGEGPLDFGGDGGVHGGKQQPRRVAGLAFFDREIGDGIGRRRRDAISWRREYLLPAERSLAPSHVRSNHGWPSRNLMKCWPTMPVAPRMPTSMRVCIIP